VTHSYDPFPASPEEVISPVQARHVLHQFGATGGYQAGSFTTHLLAAIAVADTSNNARLSRGFPGYVAAVGLAQGDVKGIEKLQKIAVSPEPPSDN